MNVFGNVNGFTNIVNPANDVNLDGITHDQITVVAAYRQIATLAADANAGANSFTVSYTGGTQFDNGSRRYLCLNGRNNYPIGSVSGGDITLEGPTTLQESHSAGEPVYLVEAVTYGLRMSSGIPVLFRNGNTGGGRQTIAENIEGLQFRYLLADFTEMDSPLDPMQIRGVRVTITARTRMSDPQLKDGGGFRRRTLNTYIDLRNMRDENP
jgi:hypothetical protein